MTMNLHEVEPIKREEAEKIFSSDNSEEICQALLRVAYHEKDWKWVQNKCISFLLYENMDVKRLAITCLGHIARVHGKLDKQRVMSILTKLKKDSPNLSGTIEDAIDDIKMFVAAS